MPDPPATTETKAADETAPRTGHSPRIKQDPTKETQAPTQDNLADNKQEYPDLEIDAWDWDELEASPSTGTSQPMQSPTTPPPTWGDEGTTRDPGHNGSLGPRNRFPAKHVSTTLLLQDFEKGSSP